jgi:hypothetical protein
MLPGVSSLECLFADLGVDPGDKGCQMYEATTFLVERYPSNHRAHLVLFQIAVVGNRAAFSAHDERTIRRGLAALSDYLQQNYPAQHRVAIYEAASSPLQKHRATWIALRDLPTVGLREVSSLYVPPVCGITNIA